MKRQQAGSSAAVEVCLRLRVFSLLPNDRDRTRIFDDVRAGDERSTGQTSSPGVKQGMRPQRIKRVLSVIVLVLCGVGLSLAVWSLWTFINTPSVQNERHGTWYTLHMLLSTARRYESDHGEPPPDFVLLILENYLSPELFFEADDVSTIDRDAPVLSSLSCNDVMRIYDDVEAYWAFRNSLTPQPRWQRIGDYVLDRRMAEVESMDARLIVAISPSWSNVLSDERRFVLLADGTVERRHENEPWVEQENARRREHGLDPLPALP
jgi:hypothetical protein